MKLTEGITRVSFRHEHFRISFLQPFVLVSVVTLFLSECVFTWTGNDSRQIMLFVLPFLVTLLCATAILILKFRFTFQLSRDGIACYDFWGRPHRSSWDAIADVQLVQTAGLRYLRIMVKGTTKAIWLPLFVSRISTLEELMTTYLSESAELRKKLDQAW